VLQVPEHFVCVCVLQAPEQFVCVCVAGPRAIFVLQAPEKFVCVCVLQAPEQHPQGTLPPALARAIGLAAPANAGMVMRYALGVGLARTMHL
jgi:hypothetical protein